VILVFVRLAVAVAGAVTLIVLLGNLPNGTDRGSVITRAATGLVIGLIVVAFVGRSLRSMTHPPPPPPPVVDARPVDVVYECVHCGTRLRLEVAATGKAPRHCGEEMEPKVAPAF
jgi:hypothetical protein